MLYVQFLVTKEYESYFEKYVVTFDVSEQLLDTDHNSLDH